MTAMEMRRMESGEDGIRVERVIVTERNVAQQVEREIEIERIFEDGAIRQTTVREVQYDTLTTDPFDLRAVDPDRATAYVEQCYERGLLTREAA